MSLSAYTEGVGVWFVSENKEEGYVAATLTSRKEAGGDVVFTFDRTDGKTETATIKANAEDLSSLPLMRNPPLLEATDDLTNLSYLNEPSVLQNLRVRYASHNVYTYSGIVLIAMNPFARLPLYTNESIAAYQGTRRGELDPHLFAIGEEAYSGMMRDRVNQTVVVSGESGAGKTVSAKYIMRYFASAGEKVITATGFSETEEKIMATNPILESFGNAKTTRNDNSSRFGKYIELHFGPRNNIVGAKVKVYLLERSRLIFQPKTERNYHIFYQLCLGAPPSEKEQLKLREVQDFTFTNQGGIIKIPGMDDIEEFRLTQEALSLVGVSVSQQWEIFRILSGLLWIGEIEVKGQGDKSSIAATDPGLTTMLELLQMDQAPFIKWTVNKQLVVGKQKIVKPINQREAMAVRDSVGKFIYAKMFDWLIIIINDVLYNKEKAEEGNFIGVLDIYGFEHFDVNSFEQFCINYANEKLQQEFNRRVFKMEQDEYVKEQINWSFIEFSDNQGCIEVIEGKIGILSLLDEESRMPSGADSSFLNKLHTNFGTPKHEQYFKKPRFARTSFTICHFACDVTYESEGFLDKNKDNVPDEMMDVIMSSKLTFMVEMLKKVELDFQARQAEDAAAAPAPAAGKGPIKAAPAAAPKKPTLGSVFKASLIELMITINKTNVHYIRCIKPNMPKEAWRFEANMVLAQLRACGVLETIKISSKGYPTKRTLPDFVDRYRVLAPFSSWRESTDSLVKIIIQELALTPDQYQVGISKIFLRAGLLARVEQMRSDKLRKAVTTIQKYLVGNVTRKYIKELRIQVVSMQRVFVAQRQFAELRKERHIYSSTVIQSVWRMHVARLAHEKEVAVVTKAQAFIRGFLIRKYMKTKRRDDAVLNIQRTVRGWLCRKEFVKTIAAVHLAQRLVRRRKAKKEYRKMKAEATSASNLKYELENKVVELSQNLQEEEMKNIAAAETILSLEGKVKQLQDKVKSLEDHNKGLAGQMVSANSEQNEAYHALVAEKEALTLKLSQASERKDSLEAQCAELQDKVSSMEEELRKTKEELAKSAEEARRAKDDYAKLQKDGIKMARSPGLGPSQQMNSIGHTPDSPANKPEQSNGVNHELHLPPTIALVEQQAHNGKVDFDDDEDDPEDSMMLQKPRIRRRLSSTQLDSIPEKPTDPKRTTIPATSPPVRMRNFESKSSKSNRISMLMKQPSEDERDKLTALLSSSGFEYELLNGLISGLSVPMADLKLKLPAKEILFPSHIIGIVVAHMWSYNLYDPLKRVLWGVVQAMKDAHSQFDVDFDYVFWLANILEMLSILTNIEYQMANSDVSNVNEIRRIVADVKSELRVLAGVVCSSWLKLLMGRINKLVIPAVVESQTLPGFVCNLQTSGGFFGKLMGGDKSNINVDTILSFLTKLWKIINFYYLDAEIGRNIILEILDNIGMTSFNHLLVRKNFCSWKRGMQIQYNVTRIEEWCKAQGIQQSSLNLERVMQAAKLLQLQKKSKQDVDVMVEVCYLLNAPQIKKILSIYAVSDYEDPVSPEVIAQVGSIAGSTLDQTLFLEVRSRMENSTFSIGRPAVSVDNYLPEWLELPKIRVMITLGG